MILDRKNLFVGVLLVAVPVGTLYTGYIVGQAEKEAESAWHESNRKITLGLTEGCAVDVHLAVWDELNRMNIYSAVAACEELARENPK